MKYIKFPFQLIYVYIVLTIHDIKPYCTLDNFFKSLGVVVVGYIWVLTVRVLFFNISQVPVLLPFPNIIMGIVAIFILPIMAYVLIIKTK